MKPIELFEAGDFIFERHVNEYVASVANKKLNDWLKSAVRVYGICEDTYVWNVEECSEDTHTALLVCVEKIEKECKHEPAPALRMDVFTEKIKIDMSDIKCQKCHVNLAPLGWKAVE